MSPDDHKPPTDREKLADEITDAIWRRLNEVLTARKLICQRQWDRDRPIVFDAINTAARRAAAFHNPIVELDEDSRADEDTEGFA